jgi:hypothetical protein
MNHHESNGTGPQAGTDWPQTGPGSQPWERLEGESLEQYTRFCAYLRLGVGRTVLQAYRIWLRQGNQQAVVEDVTRAPSHWRADCTQHHWRERARLCDVDGFKAHAKKSIQLFGRILLQTMRHLLRRLEDVAAMPITSWAEYTETLERIARLIPAELVPLLGQADSWERKAPANGHSQQQDTHQRNGQTKPQQRG